jgi:peptidylprolyl isomerase
MRPFVSICALVAALALAACGGDDAPVASEPTATAAKPEQAQDVKHLDSGIRVDTAEGHPFPKFEVDGTPAPPKVTVPSGPPPRNLVVKVLKKGVGNIRAKWGQRLTVHFVGFNYKTKEPFEVFWGKNNNDVFSFTFGSGEVRDGWETGLKGMRLGGQRELILPSRLAYGTGPLLYVVELVAIEPIKTGIILGAIKEREKQER